MKSPHAKIGCIVLAAGKSVRFGGVKQLYRFNDVSLLQHSLNVATNSLSEYVIVVVGANSARILSKLDIGRAQVVLNKNYEKGQSTSIISGVNNLPEDCVGTIIMVSDQPYLQSAHLNKLIHEFLKGKRSQSLALSYRHETRNPVLLPRRVFPKIATLRGDSGARSILRNETNLRLVEIRDERVFLDIDTRKSVSNLRRLGRE